MNLKQQRFLTLREFELKEDSLIYSLKGILGKQQVHIRYENIEISGIIIKTKTYSGFLLMSIILGLHFLFILLAFFVDKVDFEDWDIFIGSMLLTLIFFILFILTKTKEIRIPTSSYLGSIVFLANTIKNKEESSKFILELKLNRNQYLRKKYAIINKDESYETQLTRLISLKLTGEISHDEFLTLKEELVNKTNFQD